VSVQRYSFYIGNALPPEGTMGALYTICTVTSHVGKYVLASDHDATVRLWHAERQQFRNLPRCICETCKPHADRGDAS
jgi:hypothetical protein